MLAGAPTLADHENWQNRKKKLKARGVVYCNIEQAELYYFCSNAPFQAGIIMTIANPAYLAWMATIGSILIINSYKYGILGFIAYTIMHLTTDIIWLYFLSALSFKGGQFFGKKLQKILFFICGIFLAFFSIRFIVIALKNLF